MKQSGLRNRFAESVRNEWLYWHDCLFCWTNGADALHHIISPSSRFYVDGKHNESVLNSAPIHNHQCHIATHGLLETDEMVKVMLRRTRVTLVEYLDYELNDLDRDFLRVYGHLY